MKDEDKGSLDLTLLIEQHQKETWEWKQKEAQWIRDRNQLDGNKQIVNELSEKLVQILKANIKLKKKVGEAEGETSLVKAVGMNSPEMKRLQEINKEHQKLNGELQTSLTNLKQQNIDTHEDNIKLSRQIEDLIKARQKAER